MISHSKAQNKYYQANREKCRVSKQCSNDRLKLKTFQHYSNNDIPSCANCGVKDIFVLCLDHINGGGEEHRRELKVIGGVCLYRKLKNLNYPIGFQVLCANCNLRKEIIKTRQGIV
jgi:hypothetical protein